AAIANRVMRSAPVRYLNEALFGIDHRRTLPALSGRTLESHLRGRGHAAPDVLLFGDTFTSYYDPEIGVAAWEVLESAGVHVALAPNQCCGRPMISKGLLRDAADLARRNTAALYDAAAAGKKLIFCEPSCLSAMREDAPSLLRGEEQRRAQVIALACISFEEFAAGLPLRFKSGPPKILFHGHCHQKSMGLVPPALQVLGKIPGAQIIDSDAGCCGMAGSFGYSKDHYEVSRAIGERKLLPRVREQEASTAVVAAGTSCRHQILDFTGVRAMHPAMLLRSLID
ncbi:MAG TPA: heterodisulfide reductase-related iron-sulfur binding cluster, partial [Bryobacteraceae bacterium]|nr:heterodisulfide reductase-related iron-sulfur binding cluster [Bryobacteraceae bacterium]